MKIAVVCGSFRQGSYNMMFSTNLVERYSMRYDMNILPISTLPHFSQDIEDNPPDEVAIFKSQIAQSDAVLWVTPEYNGSIPGVLKNAIDWLSRVDLVMHDKPSIIMGCSTGFLGSVKAQLHLREILFTNGLKSPVLGGNEVLIGSIHKKFDDEGNFTDNDTLSFIDTVMDHFDDWVKKHKNCKDID
ncbi:NADPH-dependent FMN reductase [Kurthia sibirica]|uniref:NADPH-dependent FMN reductase n=1 Tax=Kurthia sibirica TaxID=202750 RepID=A0A2U3AJM8_9BACL|nr:NADPH-dependent FMN reductase [Kurthia sibirica]PWI24748.1 NADPH-dependent FMN reductase [Kurthia sibirica]GEK35115.1 FMN reductase [Kurthia sibirica]